MTYLSSQLELYYFKISISFLYIHAFAIHPLNQFPPFYRCVRSTKYIQMGLDEQSICNFWKAEGRVHLEAASVVWTSGLTVQQSRKLQRVQNRAVAAFSDKREDPTISALRLKLDPLDERRQKLALKFAQKTVKKSRHGDMFTKLENPHTGRGGIKREWREHPCKTKRHLKSALPYLTRLLNGENS